METKFILHMCNAHFMCTIRSGIGRYYIILIYVALAGMIADLLSLRRLFQVEEESFFLSERQ